MRSSLRTAPVERARPALGAIVIVRASFRDPAQARPAIDAAFEQIALVHRLMSFHEPESDLSRLNREAALRETEVHPRTFEVLAFAVALAEASDGAFDPSIGGLAVAAGALPTPDGDRQPDPGATWRDVELNPERSAVRFSKPLWLDLGGVAKGYAVDLAVEALRANGAAQASVNAGGDLRLAGPDAELVHLRCDERLSGAMPVLEIQDAAVASSSSAADPAFAAGIHVDGRTRAPVMAHRFVTVVAPTCMTADALTKPVLADAEASDHLLRRYGAHAFSTSPDAGWTRLGEVAQ
jgi:thiamine biosynthesis lipoprotein